MTSLANANDTLLDNNMAVIQQMGWYESKRHKIAHTHMYYLKKEETEWGNGREWEEDEVLKIRSILVSKDSNEYDSAVNNSNLE
tara:strand:- start:506 stop:757 length:252 start_codon:yes stop_codon:yes gene_type:complete